MVIRIFPTNIKKLILLVFSSFLFTSCVAWPAGSIALFSLFGGNSSSGSNSLIFLLFGGGSNKTLSSIEISPNTTQIAKGTSTALKATAIYSDSTTADITSETTWTSSNSNLISINNGGVATSVSAISIGTATVTASYESKIATASITVSSATLTSLQVTNKNVSLANGYSKQFQAVGIFSDSTTQNLSSDPSIIWSSSTTGVAIVSNTGLATTVGVGSTLITASYGSASDSATLAVSNASLVSITVTPANRTISVNDTKQFFATAVFSDSTTADITNQVNWSVSSGITYATISATTGLVTATSSVGSATILATKGAISGSTNLFVSNCNLTSIDITPNNPIALGTGIQFTATGNYSNCSSQDITSNVVWSSSDSSIATVSNSTGSIGYASSVSAGNVTVTATKGVISGNTTLEVRRITLTSISVTPQNLTLQHISGFPSNRSFSATGTYSDGTILDLTSQVLWNTSNPSVATISNANLDRGKLTTESAGSIQVVATRDGITGTAAVTITSDTTLPELSSVTGAGADYVIVSFSENVNVLQAGSITNWKIADAGTNSGTCSDLNNFSISTQTLDFAINSVLPISPSEYRINFSANTQAKVYTVIANNVGGGAIRDLANNQIGCPNSINFTGQDTVKPYLVTAVSTNSTTVQVTFSEPVKSSGGGITDATVSSNWTIIEDDSVSNNSLCSDPTNPSVSSVTKVSATIFNLNIANWTKCAIRYKVTAASTIVDLASTPNAMGSPNALNFIGVEQLKLVSAQAISTTNIKLTFSKSVKSDSSCSTISACSERYKIPSSLGNVISAVVGSGNEDNTVTLTHQTAQGGYVYTVIVANNTDGDQFNNTGNSFKGIRNIDDSEYVQSQPKDRASFMGLGTAIDSFDDGTYFDDPFLDGTTFSFAFSYDGKVYLGTNDNNSAAFRFEPSGSNTTLITFSFLNLIAPSCPSALGFGTSASGTCGANTIGPNSEYGVVGFTSVNSTIAATSYELLYIGNLKDGVNKIYYTQDKDSVLDWKEAAWSATGGGNTKSIQSIYGFGDRVYAAASSAHGTQAPAVAMHTLTLSGGDVTLGAGSDLSLRSVDYIGKNASIDNPCKAGNSSCVVGIDSMLYVTNPTLGGPKLFIANNGAVVHSTTTPPTSNSHFGLALSLRAAERGNATLVLPASPAGLQKLSPGQKGVPLMVEYKGRLYMARNLSVAETNTSTQTTNNGAELWKCEVSCGTSSNWKKIATASNFGSDLSNKAISLLQVNGGSLYIGFDNDTGLRIYKTTSEEINTADDGNGHLDFSMQSVKGLGGSFTKIFSSTSIYDGTNHYIYVVVGTGSNAVKVFRQVN